ncbi:hypothetical protein ACFQL1_06895 [Halomicroarcula sp. GCM10025709]|uniref:hypothetical protein n=1 Tax=Haloarcula TaxID=2237 RepID=UPI0024C30F07|nr:hypothetical protein [Halomicroarcula sp. YJ-61-S]
MFDDVAGVPEFSTASFPSDPFLAHELVHAIQHDATTVASLPDIPDALAARQGVVEGTAEYVEGRYRTACSEETFHPCTVRESALRIADVPLWLIPGRLPYINGSAFAHETLQRGGWDLLWEKTRTPPETAVEIMFPDIHYNGGFTLSQLSPHPSRSENWERSAIGQLGVNALYLKLRAHDIADPTDADAATDPDLTTETGIEHAFRHDLLREWRGDYMTTYISENNRIATHWTTSWADTQTAREITDAIVATYDQRARSDDIGWQVGNGFVTVDRTDTTVEFAYAPSQEAISTISTAETQSD